MIELPESSPAFASLEQEVRHLARQLKAGFETTANAIGILDQSEHCVYLKSADGQVLLANSNYDKCFCRGQSAVGRYGHSYLDEMIGPVSQQSDALILSGCSFIQLNHVGRDGEGQDVQLQTVKLSLLGEGHAKAAILGLTKVMHVGNDEQTLRIVSLAHSWRTFQSLDERDRQIAVEIAHGAKAKGLALKFTVTEKTIDNRRAKLLEALGLKNPMELARLLVRLQDNGFNDFGF